MGEDQGSAQHRRRMLEVFREALAAVNGRTRVKAYLEANPVAGSVYVVAIGKAAAAMAAGACDALGEGLAQALIITKTGHCLESRPSRCRLHCLESAHPVPDPSSLAAGAALLAFLESAPARGTLLFLISGGASSLVEVLPEHLGSPDLSRINRWLLGSGLSIHAMNRVRKRLSRIKAGRLAAFLGDRPAVNLMVSDVPGDDPRSIGSGLLVPHGDADLSVADLKLPDWLVGLLRHAPGLPEPAALDRVTTRIIASPAHARAAAGDAAGRLGYAVHVSDTLLTGDAVDTGHRLAADLGAAPAGLHIWGGETTVRLPPEPGRGGRCQSLALAAALGIAGRQDILLLAAGSDGSDGPGQDAGALVDGGTVGRGGVAGLDPGSCLDRADAGSFLEASGDLLYTGPTGTNVMDLVLGLKLT